jgi:hypothetical protein
MGDADHFVVPVPFRRAQRLSVDGVQAVKSLTGGRTIDGRTFGVFLVEQHPYPAIQVIVDGDDEHVATFLRVDLGALVHSIIEVEARANRPDLPTEMKDVLDRLRPLLASMTFDTPRGGGTGMDVFGRSLDAMESYVASWYQWDRTRTVAPAEDPGGG